MRSYAYISAGYATLVMLSAGAVTAQESNSDDGRPPAAIAVRASEAPVIDGRLDDEAWVAGQVLGGFVQREPIEGDPVSERTEVSVLYDDAALYIGAWLYDRDPSRIVLGDSRRDASLDDTDAFLLILDTYLDRQNGFVFGTTPSGIEYDGQVTDEGGGGGGGGPRSRQQRGSASGFNLNWDGSWEVATSTDGDGWYAEFRIPFSTLRYGSGGEQVWGVNFARNIRRRNEEAIWAPVPRQYNLYRVSLAGTLSQFQAPARLIRTVTPYALADALRDYTVPSGAVSCLGVDGRTECAAEFGGDAKIGLTQSLTLDLTANTDFAQVEVDDQQVNLTRFPLFFPEKRPFFLENAGIFSVGSSQQAELFFSRRIGLAQGNAVPIRGGARLTGRVAGLQAGFLNIQTGDLGVYDDATGTTQQVAAANNYGVARVYREFPNRTQLGGIFVSRLNTDRTSDYNLTYGLDGRFGIGQDLNIEAWGARTATPGVAGGEYAFSGGANYESRDWRSRATYSEVGSNFNPEVGFLARDAYRSVNLFLLRNVRFPSIPWFRELRPHALWQEFWDLNGFSETRLIHIDNHFEFSNGAFFQFPGFNLTGEGLKQPFEIREGIVIPPGTYNNVDFQARANTNLSAPLSMSLGGDFGGFYTGTRYGPTVTINYRYQDRLVTSLRVDYFDVRLNDVDRFTTAVVGLTGSYSFTPRIYLQAQVQYNDDTENLSTNLRFGWLDTAGTGLYVVYNDTEHFGSLARTGLPYGPQQRQLIVKYTKQFDFTR